jgi:hypothetical protein
MSVFNNAYQLLTSTREKLVFGTGWEGRALYDASKVTMLLLSIPYPLFSTTRGHLMLGLVS